MFELTFRRARFIVKSVNITTFLLATLIFKLVFIIFIVCC